MFTSQAPALLASGVLPPNELRQLTQVFANCNQSLTHRGTIDLQGLPFYQRNGMLSQIYDGLNAPPWASGNQGGNGVPFGGSSYYGGNYYGVDPAASTLNLAYTPANRLTFTFAGANPGDYAGGGPTELPPVGGGYTSNWNTYYGDQNAWDFSDRSTRNTNYYYGGPTFQVAGDSYFDNTTTQNAYVTNQYAVTMEAGQINGEDARGDRGDPAIAGPNGPPGANGDPAAAGPGGVVAAGVAGGRFQQVVQNFFFGGGGGGAIGGFPGLPPIRFVFPQGPKPLTPWQEELLRRNLEKNDRKRREQQQAQQTRDLLKDVTATLEDDCTITLTIPEQ